MMVEKPGKLRRDCQFHRPAEMHRSTTSPPVFIELPAVGEAMEINVSLVVLLESSYAGFAVAAADLSQLTAIIPAHGTSKSLTRLLKSLARFYPELRVAIGDDSDQPPRSRKVPVVQLPSGAGRSAVCNALLARLRTPYFLLLDPHCELTRDSQVERLLALAKEDKLDLAAGQLIRSRRKLWFFVERKHAPSAGLLEFAGSRLRLHWGTRSRGDGYQWCDWVESFYVARTDKVRALGGWDQELGNFEREEFFVRAHRKGLRVGLCPEVTAYRWSDKASVIDASPDLTSLAVAKMGVEQMADVAGRITKAPRRARAA